MTTIKASGRDLELKSDQDIVFYPTSNIWISQGTKLIFEGTVPDDFEVKLQATSVTADRDIILPDASGTMATQEWASSQFTSQPVATISGATQANPVVITTAAAHNFTNGASVTITDVVGMTELNSNSYYVSVLTSTTAALYSDVGLTASVDGTAFTAYVSDGVATQSLTANTDFNSLLNKPTTIAGYGITDDVVIKDTNGDIHFADDDKIFFGDTDDFSISLDTSASVTGEALLSTSGNMIHRQTLPYATYSIERNSDGGFGPLVFLYHNTTSPSTIDTTSISFSAKNSAAAVHTYGSIQSTTTNVTDGAEENKVTFSASKSGTPQGYLVLNDTNADVTLGLTGAVLISNGTTAERPSTAENGMLRYNTDDTQFEGYANGAWGPIGGGYANSDVDAHLNQSTATSNQVLSWNGSDYTWVAQTTGYGDVNVDAHLNQSNPTSGYVLSWNGSDYAWVDNAGYANSDVDSHLNQSTATANQVLSWNGSDYTWVAQTTGYSDANVDTHLNQSTANPGQILSWDGADYAWIPDQGTLALQDLSDVDSVATPSDGQVLHYVAANNQFEFTTISSYANSDVDSHLNQSTATSNTVLSWDGADYTWVAQTTGYGDVNVDAHLNQSTATANQILSWNGGDYDWIDQSSFQNVVDDTTPELGGDLNMNGNDITGTGNINITGSVTSTAISVPTITSSTDINFTAGTGATDRVEVTQSPFKIASFTTTQRDAKTSEDGDLIYNTSNNQFEIYTNTSWAAMTKVVYNNLLPSSDFVDQITNIWSANPTTPADFATWAQTIASDGFEYGNIDLSTTPPTIRSIDSLFWLNISTNNNPDPAHVTRWYDIVLPNLIEQSWFDVHTSNLVTGNVFSRVSDDTTPKLGGNLDADGKNIEKLGQVQIGQFGSVVFEGFTDDAFETTLIVTDPTADRTITFPDVTGNVITTGNLTEITNLGTLTGDIVFEGATADTFETTLTVTDPTADRTITLPDATGTVALTSDLGSLQNLTTTQRDALTPSDGDTIYNTSNNQFELYTNTSWAAMTKVVYDNLLPSSDFVDQITNIWSANPTTPADFATWAQTVASDGYQYGDINTSGETPNPIRSLDSLYWLNISTNNNPDPAHVTRWLDIVLPSLIEQSWFDVHTSNLVTGNVFSRVSDDTTPKLGGALDADGKNIENLGQVQIGQLGSVVFEGFSIDTFETTLTVTDPTADRTITLPDATGIVALTTGTTFTGVTTFAQTTEITSDLTGATGVVVHNLNNGAIFDHTSLAADFTANFTNVPTTTNRTISVVLILSQGATAYMPTAVQIDGVAQTILWQGGSAPAGTASGTDVVGFTLIRSSGGAWKVVGSATGYA